MLSLQPMLVVSHQRLHPRMETKLVSTAKQINLSNRLIAAALTIIVTVSVIHMSILYGKCVQFHQMCTLKGHIKHIDIEMFYESEETATYTTNVERADPVDWKFVVNKTYKLENLKLWTAVPIFEAKDPNQPGEMGKKSNCII